MHTNIYVGNDDKIDSLGMLSAVSDSALKDGAWVASPDSVRVKYGYINTNI